jgi:hypothetical protein
MPADRASGPTRLVWRVADETAPRPKGVVVEPCGRCSQPSLVDRVTTPDPPGPPSALVCVPCALADPEMRDQVLRMHAAQRRLLSVLPSAYTRWPGVRDA